MGIHGLAKLIADHAPSAIKDQDIKNYFGKASYHLNEIMIIIQSKTCVYLYFCIIFACRKEDCY